MKYVYMVHRLAISISVCILLSGCINEESHSATGTYGTEIISSISTSTTNGGNDTTMVITELNGFGTLGKSTQTTVVHSLQDIAKIMFYEWGDMQVQNAVAIDIANRRLFIDPVIDSYLDYTEPDYIMTDEDVASVLDILTENKIFEWNFEYGKKDDDPNVMDGGGWVLYIQYNDNTITKFTGTNSGDGNHHPDTYASFVQEIVEFSRSKEKL